MEKAERALNGRIEQLQTGLEQATSEATRRHQLHAMVVCVGLGEAITDYVRSIEQYAKSRYTELKEEQTALTAEHAHQLKSGKELLERLKTDPTDRTLRKEIEAAQRSMELIQKALRKKADALQREVSPAIRLIDELADSLRRLCDAEEKSDLKRALKLIIAHVQELYQAHPSLPSEGIINPTAWEEAAAASLNDASDFYDAHARAGFQALVAVEVMPMAVSQSPPGTAEEATQRANEAVTARVRRITERFSRPDTAS